MSSSHSFYLFILGTFFLQHFPLLLSFCLFDQLTNGLCRSLHPRWPFSHFCFTFLLFLSSKFEYKQCEHCTDDGQSLWRKLQAKRRDKGGNYWGWHNGGRIIKPETATESLKMPSAAGSTLLLKAEIWVLKLLSWDAFCPTQRSVFLWQ